MGALRRAGWNDNDIADDMYITVAEMYRAEIYRAEIYRAERIKARRYPVLLTGSQQHKYVFRI